MGIFPSPPAAVDPPDPKELNARFGRAVRRRRTAAGLGQEAFADRAGVHRTTLSLIERGRQSPTLEMIARLAAALGTTMAALVTETEAPDPPPDPPALPAGRKRKPTGE
jgi:transcriptional regulator with XRE-family HTH domain